MTLHMQCFVNIWTIEEIYQHEMNEQSIVLYFFYKLRTIEIL